MHLDLLGFSAHINVHLRLPAGHVRLPAGHVICHCPCPMFGIISQFPSASWGQHHFLNNFNPNFPVPLLPLPQVHGNGK